MKPMDVQPVLELPETLPLAWRITAYLLAVLSSVGLAIGGWALVRSVDHGERVKALEAAVLLAAETRLDVREIKLHLLGKKSRG